MANNLAPVANNLSSHGGAFNQQMVVGPNMVSKDLAFQGIGSTAFQSSRPVVWVESGSDADDASSDADGTIWADEELALPTWFAVMRMRAVEPSSFRRRRNDQRLARGERLNSLSQSLRQRIDS